MTLDKLETAQKEQGFFEMQQLISTGQVWKMEGSMGREAMRLLTSGACYLPEEAHRDYYGNKVPSRDELKPGTTGTLENSINFYNSF